jgi:hypothetical protein
MTTTVLVMIGVTIFAFLLLAWCVFMWAFARVMDDRNWINEQDREDRR